MRQSQAELDRQFETTQTQDGQECPSYKSERFALRLVSRWMGNVDRSIRRALATRTTARSSRRRLSRRWEAEAFECRCLLTNVLGGFVFEPAAFDALPADINVRGITDLGDTVVIYGGNDAGHGRAVQWNAVDGVFSDLTFLSDYEERNPGSLNSYASVGVVIPAQNGWAGTN